jgi:hypothetical protein
MSSLPQFLNPWTALIATAIAIPALLILYFLKLRRREMPVASTLLWRKAIQDLQVNAPFQRLRRNLLLLLQLLILLSLLLAFARPVTRYRPPPGARAVILLDRSASMSATDIDGRSRLDEAKRRAKELVDSMRRDSAAMIIAFDDSAETLQSFTSDQVVLKRTIDSVQPTDRKTRLKLAYELADASMAFNPDLMRPNIEVPDVYLFSDGRAEDAADVNLHGKLHFDRIGTEDAGNVGIVALSAKRNYERPTQVQVFVRLQNFGPEPVDAPVQLRVDGELVEAANSQTETTLLLPDRWARDDRDKWEKDHGRQESDSVTFDLDLTSAAVLTVKQMHRAGDVLAADDVAQVIVPPPKQLAVLLVTEGNYFLEDLMQSLRLKSPDVMLPAAYEQKQPQNYDVVIFDSYVPKWVPEAGNLVYVNSVPPLTEGPGQKVTVEKDTAGNPIVFDDEGVLDWNRDHPILKDLAMNRVTYIQHALKLHVPPEAQVLVDGLKGPLIVLARDGKRTNLIIGFDPKDSYWPLELSFPMFWHHALQFLAVGSDMDVRQSCAPGASPVIPRANLERAGAGLKQLKLKGPDGERTLSVPATGDFALPPLNHTGVYSTDPPVPQFEKIAVNLLDSNESNILPASVAPGYTSAKIEKGSTKPSKSE